ncbi:PREDICTED: uncharacterized protein LOC105449452 [Wasmannia auropunctata]|uniref:uncharacterized protein LOC105449452 n=1 Tax=Wasmannia auropunctata TaxID=64793 RepID=UPI0005F08B0A|nr:PREDICTED: uncharacterized protein LOC105449452 [Wasmannia auropunctata]
MAKTWTIVIFTDEDSVEVVPSNWIVNDKCYWPSTLTSEKLKAAIKHHDAVNTSWPSYPIRLIRNGTFDDYSTAEEKCKKAEYSSDVNSDRSNNKQNDRSDRNKRKIIKKTFGSSFDEDNLSSSDDNNNLQTKLPTPPRLTNDTSTFINRTKPKKRSEAINNDRIRNEKFERNLLQSIEKYFKEIIRQQNILKASMWQYTDSLHELTTSVNSILTNKVAHQVEETTTSFFTMFNFPLQDEENLIRVDEYLNDEKNFNVAMNELAKIGGSSVHNFTQRAMQMLITNDLAATYSWLGRRAKKLLTN